MPTLVTNNDDAKPSTVAQIAAIEFRSVRGTARLPKDERIRRIHALIESVRPMAVLAIELAALRKDELIDTVRSNYELMGPFLKELAEAAEDAKALHEIVHCAEMRLAVALANIEGEE